MRRFTARFAALAFLMGLMPVTLGGCGITCACTTPPYPGTPPPVSIDAARATVVKFATSGGAAEPAGLEASLGPGAPGGSIYTVVGPTAAAVVGAESGLVLEYVQLDALPDSGDVNTSAAQAQAAATSYLADRNRSTGILAATTLPQISNTTSVFVVSWSEVAGGNPQISVWVDRASGKPFAFADQRYGLAIAPPIVGKSAAGRLALNAVATPGLATTEIDIRFDFAHPYWEVSLASPVRADGITEHGAAVDIDAITGEATVLKSS
jgi:hypothetical protein